MALTAVAIRNAKGRAKPYKLTDGDGLFLYVTPNGGRYWRMGLWHPDAIERQLAHCDNNAVRRAYTRGEYWDERVRMMQHWSDHLDEIRKGGKLVQAKFGKSPAARSGPPRNSGSMYASLPVRPDHQGWVLNSV